MSTPPLVLLRRDSPSVSSPLDEKGLPAPTHSTFVSETTPDSVLFTAEHRWEEETEAWETVLAREGTKVGCVSLDSLSFGSGRWMRAEDFYTYPHCFSSKRLFKLPRDGQWVHWKTSKKDGSMKLVEHKTKVVLATVCAITREPYATDEEFAAAPSTRITLHPSLFNSSRRSSSSSATLPTLARPPNASLSSSSAYTPSAPSSLTSSSAFATRATSPTPSNTDKDKGKAVEGLGGEAEKDAAKSTQRSRPRLALGRTSVGAGKRAFSCPLPSFPTLACLLRQEEAALAEVEEKEREERGTGESEAELDALEMVLLTLLHEDYVRAEKGRREDEREREERGMEWDAW
ncbi:hypothetical protein JCM6882_006356 [Rhodosporidiobolus microsporus]